MSATASESGAVAVQALGQLKLTAPAIADPDRWPSSLTAVITASSGVDGGLPRGSCWIMDGGGREGTGLQCRYRSDHAAAAGGSAMN